MAITDDLRKTLTDPTPLYFAAGTADLALKQARKVPDLVEQLRAEAPARIEAVRRTDPKQVQDRAAARARDVQESIQGRVNEVLGSLDTDLKKLGESAQGVALRGVGVAFEYAVRARETYERVAEHGEQTVRTWRGESVEESRAVEPVQPPKPAAPRAAADGSTAARRSPGAGRGTTPRTTTPRTTSRSTGTGSTGTGTGSTGTRSVSSSAAKKAAAKKTAPRNGTRKTPPTK